MHTAQGTLGPRREQLVWTSEGTPKAKSKRQPPKFLLFRRAHRAEDERGREELQGPGPAPTFVGVIQLEDVRVLGVVGQLHHPAHDGDLFAGCGFILGTRVQPGGSRLPLPRKAEPGRTRPLPSQPTGRLRPGEGQPFRGTYVFSVRSPQGLGSVVQEGGS